MTRDLELHIDALIVDGLNHADGVRMGAVFSRELVRLLEGSSASPILSRDQAIDRLDAGWMPATAHARSGSLGAAVARAVHRGLVR